MVRASLREHASPAEWQSPLEPQISSFAALQFANGAAVRGFAHDSYRLDERPGCHDHLFAYRLAGAARVERRLAGAMRRAVTRAGSITVIPAGAVTSWSVEGTGRLLYFFLPLALVEGIAAQLGAGGGDVIVERLGAFDQQLGSLVRSFAQELDGGRAGWCLYAEAVITQLAVLLVRGGAAEHGRRLRPVGGLSLAARRRVLDYMAARLEHEITLADLARVAGLAPSHFSHSFRASFGCAPYQFVLRERIGRARRLLESERMPLPEIALAAGFASQAHLTTQFRRLVGTTPAAYRSCQQA